MADRYITTVVDGSTYLIEIVPTLLNPQTPKERTAYWVCAWSEPWNTVLIGDLDHDPSLDVMRALLRTKLANPGINPVHPITPTQLQDELDHLGVRLDPESFVV